MCLSRGLFCLVKLTAYQIGGVSCYRVFAFGSLPLLVDFPAQPYVEFYDMCLPRFVVMALLRFDSTILSAPLSG